MYLSATMTIDPNSLTQLRRKPTKGFRRFAELLTANLLSKKEEHETFTAISIMQELNVVLRSIGVTDVVKFTKDDQVLYDDSESNDNDDMGIAIDALTRDRSTDQTAFKYLSLLLEHHLKTLALIIEVRVSRVHDIGIYPIQISINALDTQMQATDGPSSLEDRLNEVFKSQQSYDTYTESKRAEFDAFMQQLEEAFRTRMSIANLYSRVHANVIRPGLTPAKAKSSTADVGGDSSFDNSAPMLQRYHGGYSDNSLMYMWMWSSMMHSNNTHCHHTTIVDERGTPAFSVGEEGFKAGETTTLDPETPFETPDFPIEPVEGVSGEVSDSADFGLFGAQGGDTGSSWFDSFSFGDSVGGDTGSFSDGGGGGGDGGGASCGGASCGGGCGGGCGS